MRRSQGCVRSQTTTPRHTNAPLVCIADGVLVRLQQLVACAPHLLRAAHRGVSAAAECKRRAAEQRVARLVVVRCAEQAPARHLLLDQRCAVASGVSAGARRDTRRRAGKAPRRAAEALARLRTLRTRRGARLAWRTRLCGARRAASAPPDAAPACPASGKREQVSEARACAAKRRGSNGTAMSRASSLAATRLQIKQQRMAGAAGRGAAKHVGAARKAAWARRSGASALYQHAAATCIKRSARQRAALARAHLGSCGDGAFGAWATSTAAAGRGGAHASSAAAVNTARSGMRVPHRTGRKAK